MATGDLGDITARIRRWLPTRWFPSQPVNADGSVPRVQAIAVGLATNLVSIWNAIQYATAQTRLGTSTEGWLDLFAYDFFGGSLPRLLGESDAAYIVRIGKELVRQRATRPALVSVVTDAVGAPPTIFEPWRPADCGGYRCATAMGYGVAGTYGSAKPLWVVFMTVQPPMGYGMAGVGGYGTLAAYYRIPTWCWIDPMTVLSPGMTIAGVLAAINRVRAAGIQILVQFVAPPPLVILEDDSDDIITDDSDNTLTGR